MENTAEETHRSLSGGVSECWLAGANRLYQQAQLLSYSNDVVLVRAAGSAIANSTAHPDGQEAWLRLWLDESSLINNVAARTLSIRNVEHWAYIHLHLLDAHGVQQRFAEALAARGDRLRMVGAVGSASEYESAVVWTQSGRSRVSAVVRHVALGGALVSVKGNERVKQGDDVNLVVPLRSAGTVLTSHGKAHVLQSDATDCLVRINFAEIRFLPTGATRDSGRDSE